jgi:outer membrane protein OmpA-like peptidoglycan-associated protein
MGRISALKTDNSTEFLRSLALAVMFCVLLVRAASAADIYQVTLPQEANVVSVPARSQYAICDTCPALTRMNENVVEERRPTKIAIRFSEKPDIPAKPGQQGLALEDRQGSGPFLTVNFDLDSAQVKGGERKKIEGAVASLRKKAPLKVTGFTCDLGSQAHNDRLALQRAQAVKSALIKSGLRRGDIAVVEGKGKCCFADTYPARHFANRRVEIGSQQ